MISRPGPDDLKPGQLPIQSFRDSQEQLPQLVDEELPTLHLTPYRRKMIGLWVVTKNCVSGKCSTNQSPMRFCHAG